MQGGDAVPTPSQASTSTPTPTESIYNLIPKPTQQQKKEPIYRSKYDPKAPLTTGSTFGLHGTTATVGKGIHDLKKV